MVYIDIISFFGINFFFPICKIYINFRYSIINYPIIAQLVTEMITKKELLQKIANKEIKSLVQFEKKYLQDDVDVDCSTQCHTQDQLLLDVFLDP